MASSGRWVLTGVVVLAVLAAGCSVFTGEEPVADDGGEDTPTPGSGHPHLLGTRLPGPPDAPAALLVHTRIDEDPIRWRVVPTASTVHVDVDGEGPDLSLTTTIQPGPSLRVDAMRLETSSVEVHERLELGVHVPLGSPLPGVLLTTREIEIGVPPRIELVEVLAPDEIRDEASTKLDAFATAGFLKPAGTQLKPQASIQLGKQEPSDTLQIISVEVGAAGAPGPLTVMGGIYRGSPERIDGVPIQLGEETLDKLGEHTLEHATILAQDFEEPFDWVHATSTLSDANLAAATSGELPRPVSVVVKVHGEDTIGESPGQPETVAVHCRDQKEASTTDQADDGLEVGWSAPRAIDQTTRFEQGVRTLDGQVLAKATEVDTRATPTEVTVRLGAQGVAYEAPNHEILPQARVQYTDPCEIGDEEYEKEGGYHHLDLEAREVPPYVNVALEPARHLMTGQNRPQDLGLPIGSMDLGLWRGLDTLEAPEAPPFEHESTWFRMVDEHETEILQIHSEDVTEAKFEAYEDEGPGAFALKLAGGGEGPARAVFEARNASADIRLVALGSELHVQRHARHTPLVEGTGHPATGTFLNVQVVDPPARFQSPSDDSFGVPLQPSPTSLGLPSGDAPVEADLVYCPHGWLGGVYGDLPDCLERTDVTIKLSVLPRDLTFVLAETTGEPWTDPWTGEVSEIPEGTTLLKFDRGPDEALGITVEARSPDGLAGTRLETLEAALPELAPSAWVTIHEDGGAEEVRMQAAGEGLAGRIVGWDDGSADGLLDDTIQDRQGTAVALGTHTEAAGEEAGGRLAYVNARFEHLSSLRLCSTQDRSTSQLCEGTNITAVGFHPDEAEPARAAGAGSLYARVAEARLTGEPADEPEGPPPVLVSELIKLEIPADLPTSLEARSHTHEHTRTTNLRYQASAPLGDPDAEPEGAPVVTVLAEHPAYHDGDLMGKGSLDLRLHALPQVVLIDKGPAPEEPDTWDFSEGLGIGDQRDIAVTELEDDVPRELSNKDIANCPSPPDYTLDQVLIETSGPLVAQRVVLVDFVEVDHGHLRFTAGVGEIEEFDAKRVWSKMRLTELELRGNQDRDPMDREPPYRLRLFSCSEVHPGHWWHEVTGYWWVLLGDSRSTFWEGHSYAAWVIPGNAQLTLDLFKKRHLRESTDLFDASKWPEHEDFGSREVVRDARIQMNRFTGVVDLHGEFEIDGDEIGADTWGEGCWYAVAYRAKQLYFWDVAFELGINDDPAKDGDNDPCL